ncbi:hypothetical protein DSUL_50107 [Desulfovibrionales bacterium]
MAGGGEVGGAIHAAAGPKLLASCREIVHTQGLVSAGGVVITPGFGLAADFIIHAVGPIWQGGGAQANLRP